MLHVEEAVRRLTAAAAVVDDEEIPLLEGLGRILSEDVVSGEDIPAFDRAAMDGYALRAADVARATAGRPAQLRVIDRVAAGHRAEVGVEPGTAVGIATGAPLPMGADAVIRFEETREENGLLSVFVPAEVGENIGIKGEDMRAGDQALLRGTRLGPAAIGVLAALGRGRIRVYRRPVVAIIPTGDEVVGVEQYPAPGQVRNSTAYALAGAVEQAGGRPRLMAARPDQTGGIVEAVKEAASGADAIITTGGASVGRHDLIRDAFRDAGAEILFWRVAMKPGMNICAARLGRVMLAGLSGNPAAALATFEVVVRPAVTAMGGRAAPLVRATGILDQEAKQIPARERYLRMEAYHDGGSLRARSVGSQLPSVLSSLAQANAFAVIPRGNGTLAEGTAVTLLLMAGQEGAAVPESGGSHLDLLANGRGG